MEQWASGGLRAPQVRSFAPGCGVPVSTRATTTGNPLRAACAMSRSGFAPPGTTRRERAQFLPPALPPTCDLYHFLTAIPTTRGYAYAGQAGTVIFGYFRGRNGETLAYRSFTRNGSMYSYSSGISRQMMRFPFRLERNFFDNLFLCAFSMTNTSSAQSRSAGVTGFCAPAFNPAEATSSAGSHENTCSAVGLRSRF